MNRTPPAVARWKDGKLIYFGVEPFVAEWGREGSESLGIDVHRRSDSGQTLGRPSG